MVLPMPLPSEMNYSITLTDSNDPAIRDAIVGPLVTYNLRQTGLDDFRPLAIVMSDASGQPIGGLWGRTVYGWLFVELLFVPESLRGNGVGTELLRRAEVEALARGCQHAWLDTFQFQARGFYERLGYTCFGELADYPPGFSRYFMRKALEGTKN
jgi:GNAT superfamily N-acetyltransferase